MRRLLPIALVLALLAPAAAAQAPAPEVTIARVKYGGGGDWYTSERALVELIRFARANTLLDLAPREDVVELTSDRLFQYKFLHLRGHGNVAFTDAEVERLRRYLTGGGFLHIDDDYGLDPYIRREMKKVFPDQEFVELPHDHPIYHVHYSFPDGLPKVHEHDGKPPQGFGLFHDGRLVVFYSYETDLGNGWDPPEVHGNPPEVREKALKMGTNLLVYAMMH